ncbi:hypothetical protein H6G27_05795 [Nostoc linckia FACHB-104]|nr:hypothetical protein [Nostoc linckia FACHB-104]
MSQTEYYSIFQVHEVCGENPYWKKQGSREQRKQREQGRKKNIAGGSLVHKMPNALCVGIVGEYFSPDCDINFVVV